MAKLKVFDIYGSEDESAARVLSPLVNGVDTAQLTFSVGGAITLIEALRVAPYKKSESDIISSTTIVLTAALMVIGLAEDEIASEMADAKEDNKERQGLRAWGRVLRRKGYDAALMSMAQDFFSEVPHPHFGDHIDYDVRSGAQLSRGMRLNLVSMGEGAVTVPRLVRALVDNPQSGIAERLRAKGITDLTEGLHDGPQRRGGSPVMMREADASELTLDVHQYAAAVATVLRAAIGEFTFVLYGRWGSGKTTLTTVLEPLMTRPDDYRKAVSSSGAAFASLRYAVARHNAWKYRTPPEAWIYTYKSLADAAAAQLGIVQRLLLAVRRMVFRRGAWPAATGMLALVVLLTPLDLKLQLATLIASVAGFSVVLHLLSVGSSASRRVRELFAEHTQLASHEDKLGMLALIGDDVRSLLLAWVRPKDPAKFVPWGKMWLPAAAVALAGLIWGAGLAGAFAPGWSEILPRLLPPGLLELIPTSPGATYGDCAVFGAWILFAIGLFVAPWLPLTKASSWPDRVLLIVDDLDRCQPEEMLSVIEGLKLLLDIPEVAERLQITMLVDEDVLGHAISRRYHAMITQRVEAMSGNVPTPDPARRLLVEGNIIAEQTEKLFACSLRIGQLNAKQLANLIAKLAGREFAGVRDEEDGNEGLRRPIQTEMNGRAKGSGRPTAPQRPDGEEREDDGKSEGRETDASGGTSSEADAPLLIADDVRFTSSEILTLQQRVPEYFLAVGRMPSPRAVRMLTFKIQLCRFLLQQRAGGPADWSVDRILDALTKARAEFNEREDVAVTIARQVI